jgi:hypothetical protein
MVGPRHRPSLAVCCLLLAASGLAAEPLRLTPDELAVRQAKAGKDPIALLRLTPFADKDAARNLRRRVRELLTARTADATPADLQALTARMAAVLPEVIHSPAEAREILGPPHQVSRQVLYRRYLEEWTYERPLPLSLVFSRRTGELPRLQAVHRQKMPKM